jgi:luciferase family oxidoreductase group 1
MIPFSVLDLAPINAGSTAADALHDSLALAQQAERCGYHRYWLAEHHNMPGVASAATAVVIGYIAGGTSTIRVGSGGIMLPNHPPLIVAEQFGTLASLYPGRIDLGLGRAPGADALATHALRRHGDDSAERFPQDVIELRSYFARERPGQKLRAVPGAGLEVPIWLLGSSLFSAQLAAELGLPFAFASHFAPDELLRALAVYRGSFRPSPQLSRPHAMLGVNVLAAESEAEARRLFTSQQQAFLGVRRGMPGRVPPPVDDLDAWCTPAERAQLDHLLTYSFVGSAATVEQGLRRFIGATRADELMLTAQVYDQAARLRSYEIVAGIRERLPARKAAT